MKYGSPTRVLVADDYEASARSIAHLLELHGHEVMVAFDGIAAFRRALSLRPHVAVLDVEIPGLDGYNLARAFRAHPQLRHTLLVCLTGGRTEDSDAVEARLAGFDHVLTKPVEIQTLIDVIDSAPHGAAI